MALGFFLSVRRLASGGIEAELNQAWTNLPLERFETP